MYNPISYGADSLTLATGVTLGFGPGMTAPPRLLFITPTAATGITLPAIAPVPPNPPGTLGTTPGVADGFLLSIRNNANYAVTVSAASGETLADNMVLSYTGAIETLQACAINKTWYRVVQPFGAVGYRFVGTSVTVTTTDRYINMGTAGTINLLAATNYPAGVEFVTILNPAGVTYTVAPAGGATITTQTALTMTTTVSVGLMTDGTKFFLTHVG